MSVSDWVASTRPAANGISMFLYPAVSAAFSMAAFPPRTMRSARETCFLPLLALKDVFRVFNCIHVRSIITPKGEDCEKDILLKEQSGVA